MFLGTHWPRLDEKGRLILPAKFRDDLAEGLVITKGQERCLNVYPSARFAQVTAPLTDAPITDARVRRYNRVLFASGAAELPDRQGRITLPASLREYAGLTRDCAVIGANDHVEVWDAQAWTDYLAAQEEEFASMSEGVFPGML